MARRFPTFRRYIRTVSREEQHRTWLSEVWQPVLLAVFSLLVWGVSRGFFPVEKEPDIDYREFFHGKAEHLEGRKVRLEYDFEPVDDPLIRYPQLQDWSFREGVVKDTGWLMGDASLNVAFEDEVDISLKFRISRGKGGIMPAVGVRGDRKEMSFIGVLLEREGRLTVFKYLSGMPHTMRSMKGLFNIALDEEHLLRISAKEVIVDYDPEAVPGEKADLELQMHPEIQDDLDLFRQRGTAAEGVGETSVSAAGRVPAVRLTVVLDGFELLTYTVPGYELKGWMSLLSWNCTPLYDDIVIEGRLYPLWVIKEMQTRQILATEGAGKETQ